MQDRQLEVHRAPAEGTYCSVQVVPPGTPVRPLAFPDLAFDWSVALV